MFYKKVLRIIIVFLVFFSMVYLKISLADIQQKISLDLRNMDILDVLKLLSQKTGMNIVAARDIQGKVTIFLKDVPAFDAFETILSANGLAYDIKDNIITVMSQRDYELLYGQRHKDRTQAKSIKLKYAKADQVVNILNQMKSSLGRVIIDQPTNSLVLIDVAAKINEMSGLIEELDLPTETKIYPLNFAKAGEVKTKLEAHITKGIGMIEIDERTNKIFITDLKSKIKNIDNIISALDEKTKEVLIDAKIVQVHLTKEYALGIDWDFILSKAEVQTRLIQNFLTSGKTVIGIAAGASSYTAVVSALETIGKTNLLSAPRITTISGQEAKILVGTTKPYVTQTVSQTTSSSLTAESVSFIDVGVKLYVTPVVNNLGFVTMKIRPEVSSAPRDLTTASGNKIPIIEASETETSVMVKDGVTIVIAGLIDTTDKVTYTQIPILCDIPLLGNLFKKVNKEPQKKEVIVFLTPHIISGDSSGKEASLKNDDIVVPMSIIQNKEVAIGRETINKVSPLGWQAGKLDYYNYIKNSLINFLSKNSLDKNLCGTVKVSFVLADDGRLKDTPAIIKSSNKALEEIIISSIKKISPFAPFPTSLAKQEENFEIEVQF
ncbi:MAG: secretin N-terminal domain-containing protein [Candidatus Omnitrophota bacterium]